MKIVRKIRHDGTVLVWHCPRIVTLMGREYEDGSRYACKRFTRSWHPGARMQEGDLRNLKEGDRVCIQCAQQNTQLNQRLARIPGKQIGVVRK